MDGRILFLDTETDGLHDTRQIWEVGAILRLDDREIERHLFIDIDLSTADPFGLKVGRFYERHPIGKWLSEDNEAVLPRPSLGSSLVPPEYAASVLARMSHGSHIVGAVPWFDTDGLNRLLRQYKLLPGWHYHLIDIESLAIGYLQGKGFRFIDKEGKVGNLKLPWKSEDIFKMCGVETPESERHTAMGDARSVRALFDVVTA
jgi:hypothetical protein